MRRLFAIGLPLALVMALSSHAFADTRIITYDVGTLDLSDTETIQEFSFSRSAWVSLDSFTFSGTVDNLGNSFAEDLVLKIVNPAEITEEDDGVLFSVGSSFQGSFDANWPAGSGVPGRWDLPNDGDYSATFNPAIAFDGTHGHFPQTFFSFQNVQQGQVWTDVVIEATVTVVPEPATAGLMGLGALALVRRRRRPRVA